MRKGKKYAAKLCSLLLSLLMSLSLCLTPAFASDDPLTTVKQGVLNFFSLLLARSGIVLSNMASDPQKYWSSLQSIIAVYSASQNVDWDKVNSEIQYGSDSIRATSKAFNAVNSVVNWLRDSYDISSLLDQGISVTPIYFNSYSTYIEAVPNIRLPALRSVPTTAYSIDFQVNSSGVRVCGVWTEGAFPGIYMWSRSPFSAIVNFISSEKDASYSRNLTASKEKPSGQSQYYYYLPVTTFEYLDNEQLKLAYVPYANKRWVHDPMNFEDVVADGKVSFDACFGVAAHGSIDAVAPSTLPVALSNIDSDKSYDLSLKNMKDIDIWKDSNLSSDIGVKNAIDKAIENPISIDVGNSVSIPVAYPISVGEDAAKVPIVVGKEVAADTPIAVPTAIPSDPSVPVATPIPVVPSIPDDPAAYKLPALSSVFPFSVPFDLYKAFTVLNADPVAPSWSMKIMGKDYNFDLSFLNPYMGVIHAAVVLLFVVGLIFITRYFVGGQ